MTREEILNAAKDCVCKSREADYSSPEYSFKAIADLWTDYLRASRIIKNDDPTVYCCISPKDVAAMMLLFKVARIATGRNKDDNWVDAAGYAACGGEVQGGEGN